MTKSVPKIKTRLPRNELERKMKTLRELFFNECLCDILDKIYKEEYEEQIRKGASVASTVLARTKNIDIAILAAGDLLLSTLQQKISAKDYKDIEDILSGKEVK